MHALPVFRSFAHKKSFTPDRAKETAIQPMNSQVSSIYTATYSGTKVLEMMVGDVAVMRRQSDSFLNATQILKIAGVEKGRRTKVLDKEILIGEHEKVQGGYGKYQGTWIPFERGLAFAQQYNVAEILRPLLSADINSTDIDTKEQALSARRRKAFNTGPRIYNTQKSLGLGNGSSMEKVKNSDYLKRSFDEAENGFNNGTSGFQDDFQRPQVLKPLPECSDWNFVQSKEILTSIWLEGASSTDVSQALDSKSNLIMDVPIDDISCTALHWAAVLAKISFVKLFLERGANPLRGNIRGETPLMRAVMVTNNFEQESFQQLFENLSYSVAAVDHQYRTVLHHIALASGIKGRSTSSRYYLECILEQIVRGKGSERDGGLNLAKFVTAVVDIPDKQGDTALNIAARVGNRAIVKQLIEIGANPRLPNRAGLRAIDFGITPDYLSSINSKKQTYTHYPIQAKHTRKSTEIVNSMRETLFNIDKEFHEELSQKTLKLNTAHAQLREVTKKLAENRRQVERAKKETNFLVNLQQRVRNIQRAIEEEEMKFDDKLGNGAKAIVHANIDADAPFVVLSFDSMQRPEPSLLPPPAILKARIRAYQQNEEALLQLAKELQGRSHDLEDKCRKVVAMCCGVEASKVDSLLEGLIQAVESDENLSDVDMSKVAGFLKMVNNENGQN